MIFEYDQETDMLYITLRDGMATEAEEIGPGIVLDFDADHRVVGIEIEDASTVVDLGRLELHALPIANLIVRERLAA